MKTLIIASMLVTLFGCNHQSKPKPSAGVAVPVSHCSIVHATTKGCPAGYVQESTPRFTEKDGSKEYACVSADPNKDNCLDVLKPGENAEFTITLPGETRPTQSVMQDDEPGKI